MNEFDATGVQRQSELLDAAQALLARTAQMPSFRSESLDFDTSFVPVELTWNPPPGEVSQAGGPPSWWIPKTRRIPLSLHQQPTGNYHTHHGAVGLLSATSAYSVLGVCGASGTGKTTLAVWLARQRARAFLKDPAAEPFPILSTNVADLERVPRAVDAVARSGAARVEVILDGLGWDQPVWSLAETVLWGNHAIEPRVVLFSTTARLLRVRDRDVHWAYLDAMSGGLVPSSPGSARANRTSQAMSSLGVRLSQAVASEDDEFDPDEGQVVHEYLVRRFSTLEPREASQLAGAELLEWVALTAWELQCRGLQQFTWGQLESALQECCPVRGSRLDLQRFRETGDIGCWLLSRSGKLGLEQTFSFSHDRIREGLVARGLAQLNDDELRLRWRRLPLGPAKVRLGIALVEYLRWNGAASDAGPRWMSVARGFAGEDDITQCGLLIAVSFGLGVSDDGAPAGRLGRRFENLWRSGIQLDKERARAVAPPLTRRRLSPPEGTAREPIADAIERLSGPLKPGPLTEALRNAAGEAFQRMSRTSLDDPDLRARIAWPALASKLCEEPELTLDIVNRMERGTALALIRNLGKQGEAGASCLAALLEKGSHRLAVVQALGSVLSPRTLAMLEVLAEDSDWMIRREVALALGSRGDNVGRLVPLLSRDDELSVRFAVVTAALRSEGTWATPFVASALESAEESVRVAICLALIDQRTDTLKDQLEVLLHSSSDRLAAAAAACLSRDDVLEERGGLDTIGARFALPQREMRFNHVLTDDSTGDVEGTISWLGNKVLTLAMNRTGLTSEAAERRERATIEFLLGLAGMGGELEAMPLEQVAELGRTDSAIAQIVSRGGTVFREQVRAIALAMGSSGVRLFPLVWQMLIFVESHSGEKLTKMVLGMEDVNLVAEAFRARFRRSRTSNVFDAPMAKTLRSFSTDYVLAGLAQVVRRGGLDAGSAKEVAEFSLDLLARTDVDSITADDLIQLETVLDYLRTGAATKSQAAADDWGGLRYIEHLASVNALHLARDYRGAQIMLRDTPIVIRNRTWWSWSERLAFVEGDFEQALAAREQLRPDNHLTSDQLSLGARSANILGQPSHALALLGFSVGVDRATLLLQAAIIKRDAAGASAELRRLGTRVDEDAYLGSLRWLEGGLSGIRRRLPPLAGTARGRRDELLSEFGSTAYEGIDGLEELVEHLRS